MKNIKVPFSQQIYDQESDKVHNVRILENNSKKERRRFRYLLLIGYENPITLKLAQLPEDTETLKRLVTYCIKDAKAK